MVSADSLPPTYFERMYAASPDPWDFAGRWYEERKRAITVASLPRRRFRRAFEPGCSIGLLSAQLGQRCDELLASDVSSAAVRVARDRLSNQHGVHVDQRQMPRDWPDGRFDLVVLSEIVYYCNEADAVDIGLSTAGSLTADGVVVVCHWLHPVADYPLSGVMAHRIVREASGLEVQVRHEEADFLLEVLALPGTRSVARAEGLLG